MYYPFKTVSATEITRNNVGVLITPTSPSEPTMQVCLSVYGLISKSKDGLTVSLLNRHHSQIEDSFMFLLTATADSFISKLLGAENTAFVNADAKAYNLGIEIVDSTQGNHIVPLSSVQDIRFDGDNKAFMITAMQSPVTRGLAVNVHSKQICFNSTQVAALKLAIKAVRATITTPTDLATAITSIGEIKALLTALNITG